ncbi:tetratricopeptide repeat protein [Streptomyces sp. NPDC006365]|uniref:tetratricopeptide repeat protein n=1 Tax=Streptomyces sp. NPDC006365 TaxID=3364744 RepID=UPI003684E535
MTDQAVGTQGKKVPAKEQRPAAGSSTTPGFARAGGPPSTEGQFLGRTRELKELRADIERAGLDTLAGRKAPRARVLLIAGKPGFGRTALAEELVRQVAESYRDGTLRARLSEPDGTPVPTERTARDLLAALELTAPPGAPEDDLVEALREGLATRRVLLLLDDAADAEQVDALLPDNPECLVVAVSDGPLTGISDVRPCTLGGLDTKSAVELLGRYTGSVRITVDPRAAEGLVEICAAQPAALVLAGGWLARRPKAAVADLAKQVCTESDEGPALERVFRLVYAELSPARAQMLRLLSLAPAGLVDPHTASALAGCSVGAAESTLDDFVGLGLVRRVESPLPQYEVPGCLLPLLRSRTESEDRPAELQLARARMLERTVRLLASCRAITETDSSPAREKLAGMPRALRFKNPRAAADWLRIRQPALLASARLAVADGELDTLARRLMAALVRAMVAHFGTRAVAPELYGIHQLVLDVAERRKLPREKAAALLNLADLDARTGRTSEALARYRAALDAGREANDPYATGRAMESVGGAHQELGDFDRAADWYGRALAQRLARDERVDAARLHGRIATVHTYAGRYDEALRSWRSAVTGHRRNGDVAGVAKALSELARVQEYSGRPEESLRTCQEAIEWARRAEDVRLRAALQLRLADTLDRLGDPVAARLHRGAAERMLGDEFPEDLSAREHDANAYEIRSTSAED